MQHNDITATMKVCNLQRKWKQSWNMIAVKKFYSRKKINEITGTKTTTTAMFEDTHLHWNSQVNARKSFCFVLFFSFWFCMGAVWLRGKCVYIVHHALPVHSFKIIQKFLLIEIFYHFFFFVSYYYCYYFHKCSSMLFFLKHA